MIRGMPALFFLGAFLVFLRTACGSYDLVDAGEIMGAGLTLGIIHPPGYPLITPFLRLLEMVPAGSTCFRMNLLGPLGGAATAALMAVLARRIAGKGGAALLALPFVLHPAFWLQSLGVKGGFYTALTASFMFLAVLLARPGGLSAALAGLLAGLGFALQTQGGMMIVLALAAAIMANPAMRKRFSARNAGICLLMFLLGAGLYLFLPVRSAATPPVYWGAWHKWAGVKEILRWSAMTARLNRGGLELLGQTPHLMSVLVIAVLAVAGNILGLFAGRHRAVYAASLAVVLATVMHFLPIDIFAKSIQHSLPLWAGGFTGLLGLLEWLRPRVGAPAYSRLAATAAAGAVTLAAWLAHPGHAPDLSRYYAADDYARNIAAFLPPGRGLLISFGDFSYDPLRFRQLDGKGRLEVAHVRLSSLTLPAYGDHLRGVVRDHPWLVQPPPGSLGPYIDVDTYRLVVAQKRGAWVLSCPHLFTFQGTLRTLDPLHPTPAGFVLNLGGPSGPAVPITALPRMNYRGLLDPSMRLDRWNANLPYEYAFALQAAIARMPVSEWSTGPVARATTLAGLLLNR